MNEQKKITVNLPKNTASALDNIVKNKHMKQSDAVRHSIELTEYLQEEVSKGSKILIRDAEGNFREIYFK